MELVECQYPDCNMLTERRSDVGLILCPDHAALLAENPQALAEAMGMETLLDGEAPPDDSRS
jgi:hypothetical protein